MEYKIFGCKTNKYFTEKWLNTDYLSDKTWTFIASCIVTDKAKSKWIKYLKDTIKWFQNKNDKIYLSGCWTIKKWELVNDFYKTYPELKEFEENIILLWEDPEKSWIEEKVNILKKRSISTRKYVIIQNWCDNYCTFCLTIKARWKHFSRKTEEIINEIQNIEKLGVKEIILTWTNIGAWWTSNTIKYKETKLNELLREILSKTNIPRIRISSLWIEYIDDELLEIFQNTRIYPHFHLSIQSWSDKILKSMNRNYSRKTLENTLLKINSIKRDDNILISIWADFIVGFPWEDEKDFEDTLEIIEKYNIVKVHCFPFSSHKKSDSIPAWLFPNQVDEKIKHERIKLISELGENIRKKFLKLNSWKELNLLLERVTETKFTWWSENYIDLNEYNFTVNNWEIIRNWNIVKWIYNFSEQ